MSENAHEQAVAAIESMGGLDAAIAGSTTESPGAVEAPSPTPDVSTTQRPSHWQQLQRNDQGQWVRGEPTPPTPGASEVSEQPPVEPEADTSFMGENFDPNSLPPELQPAYKQMQGHFTKTQQELRERERQFQEYGAPEEIAKAVELRNMLSDPRNYVQLHQELTEYLKASGVTPAEAAAVAQMQIENAANAGTPTPSVVGSLPDDPEFEPYKQAVGELQTQLQNMKGEFDSYRQQREAQEMELAIVGQVQRQVAGIRQERPDYTDTDIDAIFELATYHDGDILAAQKRYDEIFTDRMGRYLNSKQAPAAVPSHIQGAGITTAQPSGVKTWGDAKAAALEIARQIDGSN